MEFPVVLVLVLIALLIYMVSRRKRREAARANYNRKIGQTDLNAPMPSETYAAQRRTNSLLTFIVIVIVLVILFIVLR